MGQGKQHIPKQATEVTAKIQNPKQQDSCRKPLQGGQSQSPGRKDSQVLLEPSYPASSLSWYLGLEVMLTWFVWKGTSVREIKLQKKGPHLGIVSNKGKNEQEATGSWGLRSFARSVGKGEASCGRLYYRFQQASRASCCGHVTSSSFT